MRSARIAVTALAALSLAGAAEPLPMADETFVTSAHQDGPPEPADPRGAPDDGPGNGPAVTAGLTVLAAGSLLVAIGTARLVHGRVRGRGREQR